MLKKSFNYLFSLIVIGTLVTSISSCKKDKNSSAPNTPEEPSQTPTVPLKVKVYKRQHIGNDTMSGAFFKSFNESKNITGYMFGKYKIISGISNPDTAKFIITKNNTTNIKFVYQIKNGELNKIWKINSNGQNSNIVFKFRNINSSKITLDVFDYNWQNNTGSLIYESEINVNSPYNSNSIYYNGTKLLNHSNSNSDDLLTEFITTCSFIGNGYQHFLGHPTFAVLNNITNNGADYLSEKIKKAWLPGLPKVQHGLQPKITQALGELTEAADYIDATILDLKEKFTSAITINNTDNSISWGTDNEVQTINSDNFTTTNNSYVNVETDLDNIVFNVDPDNKCLNKIINISCTYSAGYLTIEATGGVPPYEFSVDGSSFSTSNSIAVPSKSNYDIAIYDNDKCIKTYWSIIPTILPDNYLKIDGVVYDIGDQSPGLDAWWCAPPSSINLSSQGASIFGNSILILPIGASILDPNTYVISVGITQGSVFNPQTLYIQADSARVNTSGLTNVYGINLSGRDALGNFVSYRSPTNISNTNLKFNAVNSCYYVEFNGKMIKEYSNNSTSIIDVMGKIKY